MSERPEPGWRERILAVDPSARDRTVDAWLGIGEPPPDAADLPRGAVPYLPAGVDEIVAMADELPLRADDVFVDLGSGLGRVAILAHLLTGARARGIEIQPQLVAAARASAARLGLADVTFEHADASQVALEGSVFFLYAPFNGAMLRRVLERLQAVALRRPIRVAAVDLPLGGVTWLSSRPSSIAALTLHASQQAS